MMEWLPRGLPSIHAPIPICGESYMVMANARVFNQSINIECQRILLLKKKKKTMEGGKERRASRLTLSRERKIL